MKMKLTAPLIIASLLMISFPSIGQKDHDAQLGDPFEVDPSLVSFYRLLTRPEDFHQRTVTVGGFVHRWDTLGRLCASREDDGAGFGKNTVELKFVERCEKLVPFPQYAYLRGKFEYDANSRFGGRLFVEKANPTPDTDKTQKGDDARLCEKYIGLLEDKALKDLTAEERVELQQLLIRLHDTVDNNRKKH
jgi:hypothetical protein